MADHTTTRQLVVFTLGTERYALPIDTVQEIIRFTEPRSVASPEPEVRGVISLRGRIVPVYDVASRLGIFCEVGEDAKIVVVESNGLAAGLIVESVEEVLTVEDGQIEDAPTADTDLIEAIVRVDDQLIVLLTLHQLWRAVAELTAVA